MARVNCFSRMVLLAGLTLLAAGCTPPPPAPEPAPKPREQTTLKPLMPPMPPAPAPAPPPRTVRLVGVGDIMMGTDFPDAGYLNPDLTSGADLAALIGPRLLGLLQSGDITFGNMEGSLFDGDGEHKPCKNPKTCYVFRSPSFHGEFLREMGFDVMSVANNHSGDFRAAGRNATMAALGRNGIAFAGIDAPGLRTATLTLDGGVRVGVLAVSPNWGTVSINDHARAAEIVRQLNARHDIVLVSFHGGAEGREMTRVPREMEIFYGEERGDVYGFAHAMIDAGADVVLGHGPHVPRAVEIYRGRFIAYSLGNFWTYGRFNLRDLAGVAPVVDLKLARDGRLLNARIHSARQHGGGVPRLDDSGAAARAIAELTAQDFPESGLRFGPDGEITGFAGAAEGEKKPEGGERPPAMLIY
ncbi:MAG: CapA family protein [Alphaproteobacteria bacterium]|nr:CapA family protein [Alphaproteobacteria bacterium]